MRHFLRVDLSKRFIASGKSSLFHHHYNGFINANNLLKQEFWREFSSSRFLKTKQNEDELKQSSTSGNNNTEQIVVEEINIEQEQPTIEFTKFSSQGFQLGKSGFISSMNILEFTDDTELEECNRIISSLNIEKNNLVLECNALLKRIYIEIYFLREYEKARLDVLLVRKLVGEEITEELDRFLSQLNSYINIEVLNEKINVANTEGNSQLLIPLVEKRCLDLANVGKYKQSLEDLDFNIQSIEKLLKSESDEKTKLQAQLLNMYKERMNLFVNIKEEMERLLSVGQELSALSHDSSQESVHLYFTTTSLIDPRHKLNGGNMDLIREFENIFLKDEEKARLWDISHSRTFQKNLLPLSVVVIEKCINEITTNLERAEQLVDKTNPSYHFADIKRAIEDDIKRQKTQQINKYIIYVGLAVSLVFLILSSPKVGVIKVSP